MTLEHWERTTRSKYRQQKQNARKREIEWDLSYEEWLRIWDESGLWGQRGRTKDGYVMGRIDDEGSYSAENVRIISQEQNRHEYLAKRWFNITSKDRMSKLEEIPTLWSQGIGPWDYADSMAAIALDKK